MAQIVTRNEDGGWFAVLIRGSVGPEDENSKPTDIRVLRDNLCQSRARIFIIMTYLYVVTQNLKPYGQNKNMYCEMFRLSLGFDR